MATMPKKKALHSSHQSIMKTSIVISKNIANSSKLISNNVDKNQTRNIFIRLKRESIIPIDIRMKVLKYFSFER